ncbi:PTS fructose transporter subunit IIA [Clostridium algidicarnis]|uniref:PTS sugar transporter subunit IIA domain-containing protein n=1 Tax=Clostridium algidicarnis TaxID=37659 RepID=UPI001C0B4F27|nr:PTS fructose transporter subunit IIA [Clostridium algidicarnis]MBU3194803.1 PTS fructose transporter subunit IIA [Clostridium algidicarnis]
MKNVIILIGHGNYATGLKSTIKSIVGPTEGVNYIDFIEEDNTETFMEKAVKVVEENKGNNIVFICDIIGGTPFNTAVKISLENEGIGVVAGCNIGAIIEIIIAKDSYELEELLDELVEKTKKSVLKYKNIEIALHDTDEEDGI